MSRRPDRPRTETSEADLFDTVTPLLPAIRKRLARHDVEGLARILGSDRTLLGLVTRMLETAAPAELAVSNEALLTLRKAAAIAQLGPGPPTRQPERSTARIPPVPAAARSEDACRAL
jgi:hypothetical protein